MWTVFFECKPDTHKIFDSNCNLKSAYFLFFKYMLTPNTKGQHFLSGNDSCLCIFHNQVSVQIV